MSILGSHFEKPVHCIHVQCTSNLSRENSIRDTLQHIVQSMESNTSHSSAFILPRAARTIVSVCLLSHLPARAERLGPLQVSLLSRCPPPAWQCLTRLEVKL